MHFTGDIWLFQARTGLSMCSIVWRGKKLHKLSSMGFRPKKMAERAPFENDPSKMCHTVEKLFSTVMRYLSSFFHAETSKFIGVE